MPIRTARENFNLTWGGGVGECTVSTQYSRTVCSSSSVELSSRQRVFIPPLTNSSREREDKVIQYTVCRHRLCSLYCTAHALGGGSKEPDNVACLLRPAPRSKQADAFPGSTLGSKQSGWLTLQYRSYAVLAPPASILYERAAATQPRTSMIDWSRHPRLPYAVCAYSSDRSCQFLIRFGRRACAFAASAVNGEVSCSSSHGRHYVLSTTV